VISKKDYFCYIHIPFCTSKCKYCRFASTWNIDKLKVELYVKHLLKEIKTQPLTPSIVRMGSFLKSIYFWGWTPSVLNLEQLDLIIKTFKYKYWFDNDIEITLEATPITVTKQNLDWWKKIWITRLSIGVQSLNTKSLNEIWRWEKWDIIKALDNILEVWFNNISIDFIIWLPHVKKWEAKKDIEYILNNYNFIKHISVYMLEEYYYPDNWEKLSINENTYLSEYIEIKNFLKLEWFNKYEVSNFAKPWFECKHNKSYWDHSEMLAFGLWSHGYIDWIRFSNSENFINYYSNKWKIIEKLYKNDLFLEKLMFDLRTTWLDAEMLKKINKNKINYFINNWFLEKNHETINLTDKWVLVLDYILKEIV